MVEEKPAEETQTEGFEDNEKEEFCDPATMNCDEIQHKVIDELIPKSIKYEREIAKLNEVKDLIPEDIIKKKLEEKKEIDDEIHGLFERYTVCNHPAPTEEETEKKESG